MCKNKEAESKDGEQKGAEDKPNTYFLCRLALRTASSAIVELLCAKARNRQNLLNAMSPARTRPMRHVVVSGVSVRVRRVC